MAQNTSGGTSEGMGWAEFLSTLFIGVIVIGFNPVVVILGGMMWYIPMTVPATVLEQPIVKDMMFIGMIQYWEFWLLSEFLLADLFDHGRIITPRDVGALLLDTIPFFGLAFYALLTSMNTVLKITLVAYGTIGGLPTMITLARLLNAPWLLPGNLIKDP